MNLIIVSLAAAKL